jgi:hypothetical protein
MDWIVDHVPKDVCYKLVKIWSHGASLANLPFYFKFFSCLAVD